ncbi:MAG: thioesterase family protein [Oscillospiraceae bacterium]|nr:thioesterase family protein [Oscillospiraceae bacterium]
MIYISIKLGNYYILNCIVEQSHLAINIKSGTLPVLSTPYMIAYMENASLNCILNKIDLDKTTVGIYISAHHISPTPINSRIKIISTISDIDKNIISFDIEAFDEYQKIGYAKHKRCIIDTKEFKNKYKNKEVK